MHSSFEEPDVTSPSKYKFGLKKSVLKEDDKVLGGCGGFFVKERRRGALLSGLGVDPMGRKISINFGVWRLACLRLICPGHTW